MRHKPVRKIITFLKTSTDFCKLLKTYIQQYAITRSSRENET
jgi:hypothetical protein